MRVTHNMAEVQTVIVRNFAPALPGLVQRYNAIEALAGSVC